MNSRKCLHTTMFRERINRVITYMCVNCGSRWEFPQHYGDQKQLSIGNFLHQLYKARDMRIQAFRPGKPIFSKPFDDIVIADEVPVIASDLIPKNQAIVFGPKNFVRIKNLETDDED